MLNPNPLLHQLNSSLSERKFLTGNVPPATALKDAGTVQQPTFSIPSHAILLQQGTA
jgi:hypothetical protein